MADERRLSIAEGTTDDEYELGPADILVYAPGETIALSDNLIPAKILDVSISGNFRIRYELSYWNGIERFQGWADACEVHGLDDSKKLGVGFCPGKARND